MSSRERSIGGHCQTSLHVRRALEEDDADSWAWLVERLTPWLELQASHRMAGPLLRHLDPRDVVNDVWVRTLPKLTRLPARNGRITPVVVRFLASSILLRINEIIRQEIRSGHASAPTEQRSSAFKNPMPIDNRETSAEARLTRAELQGVMYSVIAELSPRDREVLVLRGIEQVPNQEVARMLGMRPGTVSTRYQRALVHLRAKLPRALLDGFPP